MARAAQSSPKSQPSPRSQPQPEPENPGSGPEAVLALLIEQLQDACSAEQQALDLYPDMIDAASADSLREALNTHRGETEAQLQRLDRSLGLLDSQRDGRACQGMRGLIAEAKEQIEQYEPGPLLDVVLIAAAQRIEHYEIAAYGTMATLAESVGEPDVAELLEQTLEEEKSTDQRLSALADDEINPRAVGEDDEEDEDEDEDDDEEDLDGEEDEK